MSELTALTIEYELAGGVGWTDVTPDCRSAGETVLTYGIRGSGPSARLASTGMLTLTMNNINTAGLVGRYSPSGPNKRTGFGLGIRVRISFGFAGTTYWKWVGIIDRIVPESGKGTYLSRVTCVDWMDFAAKYEVQGVPVSLAVRADTIITALLAASPVQPNAVLLGTGTDQYVFAPAAGSAQTYSLASELQRLVMSEVGLCVLRGGTSFANASRLTFIPRTALTSSPYNASQGTIDNTMLVTLSPEVSREQALNLFRTTVHPRKFDDSAQPYKVLYSLGSTQAINAGATLTWTANYTDPDQLAAKVSAYEMQTPVNGVDIVINANSAGTGADLYANFTVTVTYGSDTVTYALTNNGGTLGYLTLLQARGHGIFDYTPETIEVQDSASITANGRNPVELDFAYQSSRTFGQVAAAYLLAFYKDSTTVPKSITFFANANDTLLTYALQAEPGDVYLIKEATTGINQRYRIMSVTFQIAERMIWCTWELSPVVDTTVYAQFDVSVFDTGVFGL
jgi:hypothetical protein